MHTSPHFGVKALLTLGLMLVASGPARATACSFVETRVDSLHVFVCANHGRWNYATMLYYKGLARLLGEYAHERISGTAAKEVEIQVIDPAMNGDPVFAVEQDQSTYKFQCRGLVSLRLFAQGLHYLAAGYGPPSVDWGPDEVVLGMFHEKMVAAAGEIDMSFFEGRRVVVLDLGRLKVAYQDDELFYELDGIKLDQEVQDPLPLDLGDGRFLLGSDSAAHVYQDGRIVAQREWPGIYRSTLCAMVYPGWVNFHYDDEIALTYSRHTNTFYEVDVKHDRRNRKSGAMGEYLECEDRSMSRIGFRIVEMP